MSTPIVLSAICTIAHALPVGLIQRSARVIVHQDEITVTYRITASDETLDDLMCRNGLEQPEQMERLIHPALQLNVEDQRQSLVLQRVQAKGGHHPTMQFEYRTPIRWRSSPTRLRLVDQSFPDFEGEFRGSVAGADDVQILQANVPANIVRCRLIDQRRDWQVVASIALKPPQSPERSGVRGYLSVIVVAGCVFGLLLVLANVRRFTDNA